MHTHIYIHIYIYIYTYVYIYIHRCLTTIYTHAHRHPDRESSFVHAAARLFQTRLHIGSTPGDGGGEVIGGISDTHLSSVAGAKCIWTEIFKSKWQVQGQCSRDLKMAGESDLQFVEGMSVCLRLCVGGDPHSQSVRTTQRSCWRPRWIEEPLRIEIVWFGRRFRGERWPSTTTPIWQFWGDLEIQVSVLGPRQNKGADLEIEAVVVIWVKLQVDELLRWADIHVARGASIMFA